jgi:hypothetical protein
MSSSGDESSEYGTEYAIVSTPLPVIVFGVFHLGLPDHPVISNPSTFDHPTLIAYSIAPSIEAIFIGTT